MGRLLNLLMCAVGIRPWASHYLGTQVGLLDSNAGKTAVHSAQSFTCCMPQFLHLSSGVITVPSIKHAVENGEVKI